MNVSFGSCPVGQQKEGAGFGLKGVFASLQLCKA